MTTSSIVVGVDVAKDRLDVAVRPTGEVWSEANDETGVTLLGASPQTLSLFAAPENRRKRTQGFVDGFRIRKYVHQRGVEER